MCLQFCSGKVNLIGNVKLKQQVFLISGIVKASFDLKAMWYSELRDTGFVFDSLFWWIVWWQFLDSLAVGECFYALGKVQGSSVYCHVKEYVSSSTFLMPLANYINLNSLK